MIKYENKNNFNKFFFISSIYCMENIEIEDLKKISPQEIHSIAKTNIEILKLLLEKGMHPDMPINNKYYKTILQKAVIYGKTKVVRLLLKYGSNPNIVNHNGKSSLNLLTPLYNQEDLTIAELLLISGADPNIKDHSGETILHRTAKIYTLQNHVNNKNMINLILYHGANPNIKNLEEETSIDILKKRDYPKLAKRLENVGKNLRAMLVKLLSNGQTPFNRDVASVIAQFRYNY